MTPRFKRAYDLLIKAYFNDELKAGDCNACAVGNICDGNGDWKPLFCTQHNVQVFDCFSDKAVTLLYNKTREEIKKEIESISMYSVKELAQIEYAFETNAKISCVFYSRYNQSQILADQFNGLKAVIELMMRFDGIEGDQYVNKLNEKLQSA